MKPQISLLRRSNLRLRRLDTAITIIIHGILCVSAVIFTGCQTTGEVDSVVKRSSDEHRGRQKTVDSKLQTPPASDHEPLTTNINELIKQLGDADWRMREKAQEALEEIGEPAEVMLKEASQGPDPEVRMRVTRILRMIEVKKRVKFSEPFLKEFPNIYYDLLYKLDTTGKFELLQEVTAKDNEGNYKYQNKVINQDIAGLIGEILLDDGKGLTDMQKKIILCISTGGEVGEEDVSGKNYRRLGGWCKPITESVPHIIKLLRDKDFRIRWRTIDALGLLGAKESIPEIIKLLQDENEYVRKTAVSSLGRLGAKETILEITKLLKDGDAMVRLKTICTLCTLKAKETISEIMKLRKDEHQDVRRYVARALVALGAKEIIPEILEFLKDDNLYVRIDAACILSQIRGKESIPEIVKLLQDDNLYARGCAAILLGELGAKDKVPKEVTEGIKPHLKWGEDYVRRCRQSLKELGADEK